MSMDPTTPTRQGKAVVGGDGGEGLNLGLEKELWAGRLRDGVDQQLMSNWETGSYHLLTASPSCLSP